MRRFAVALGTLFLLANPAHATQIDFLGLGKASNVTVSLVGYTSNMPISAGELRWGWIGGTPSGYEPTFYSYCVELTQAIADPQTVAIRSTDLLAYSGAPNGGGKAAWLFNTYAPTIRASGVASDAAALQVAIWEALYDTTNSITSGNFTLATTGTIATKATAYLNALYDGGYKTATATWLESAPGGGQDQIIQMPVPEPGSLLLCATGLAALVRARRRRRKSEV